MIRCRTVALACLLAVTPGLARAQAADAAAERARLGNERIQAEAERQAREAENEPSNQAAAPVAARTPPPSFDADRTDRALRQLRELGRLKDAGYLTDPEFARIKQEILDNHF